MPAIAIFLFVSSSFLWLKKIKCAWYNSTIYVFNSQYELLFSWSHSCTAAVVYFINGRLNWMTRSFIQFQLNGIGLTWTQIRKRVWFVWFQLISADIWLDVRREWCDYELWTVICNNRDQTSPAVKTTILDFSLVAKCVDPKICLHFWQSFRRTWTMNIYWIPLSAPF